MNERASQPDLREGGFFEEADGHHLSVRAAIVGHREYDREVVRIPADRP
jgi:hypothetical protein